MSNHLARYASITLLAFAVATRAGAQEARTLSLQEALRLAEGQSEAVRIARAGVQRASGQELQAKSAYLPQINGSIRYTRTLKSQFEVLQQEPDPVPPPGTPPAPPPDTTTFFSPCTRYIAPSGSPEAQRLLGLETFARCQAGGGGGIDFQRVGFGSENQYSLGLTGSIDVFAGGRIAAQSRAAAAGRRSADVELAAQRAQNALAVTEAYFDAVLADRLVAIAESSLVQTEGTLRQTRLARQVGNQSEFELLRAQVTRDNQLPVLIQRRTERDIAYLRLKQLLNLPYAAGVRLTTDIGDGDDTTAARVASLPGVPAPTESDTSVDSRAPVRQVNEALRVQEAQLRIAKSQRWPTVTLSTDYGRVAFPSSGVPDWGNFLQNWTVSLGASFPIFTGGRLKGGERIAHANVVEAQARLEQTRELAALDAQQTVAQLAHAEAAMAASQGTATQAARAYGIADVRFREGISTQLELSESRLLLEQARANRALAARNLQVTRVRLALLRDLPLGAGGTLSLPSGGVGGGIQATPGGGFVRPTQPITPRTGTAVNASTSVGQGQ
jgi:outer membrane protein